MWQKLWRWFTRRGSKKEEVSPTIVVQPPKEPTTPQEIVSLSLVELDVIARAKQKRERRRLRNLSHTSHRANDDRKTMGAFGQCKVMKRDRGNY
jgi:hypothetical protein